MKNLLSYSFLLLIVIAFCRCSDDPNYIQNYFTNQDNVIRIADGFKANYEGKVSLHITVNDSKVEVPDSLWKGKWTDEVESAPIVDYSLGGSDSMFLVVHNYPVSTIGYALPDTKLGEAIKTATDCDLVFPYKFYRSNEYTDENKLGAIHFDDCKLNLKLTYDGKTHIVGIKLNIPWGTRFDGANGPYELSRIIMDVDEISVDGKVVYDYIDMWAVNDYRAIITGPDDGHEIIEEQTQSSSSNNL